MRTRFLRFRPPGRRFLSSIPAASAALACWGALFAGLWAPAPLPGQDEPDFDPFSEEAAAALAAAVSAEADGARGFLDPGRVRELTEAVRPSLVTVRQLGRDGQRRGTGSGFVVDKEGLVVTNLHVVGQGRPVEVEFFDGSTAAVLEVRASDRRFDLAVLRVDPGGRDLQALDLRDSDGVEQGEVILGFGAPQGLAFSVVPGLVSAIRKLERGFLGDGETPDFPMLQLAMPIEQGNSGGPVVDLEGRVVGVVTLRHRLTENLGFAVLSNDLARVLERPNPVPMDRWRTVGVLDPRRWTPLMGAEWSQRGGVIAASEAGDGFGGRSLCLSTERIPEGAYEVAVQVKLDDEGGAAGLAFEADGGEVHYGFYPSAGRMRLTRFEGPDVHSWTIVEQFDAASYRPGEWNQLRVRVEGDSITGWVNGEKALEVEDSRLRGGRAGLCKFRQTRAEFRGFQVGRNLGGKPLTERRRERLDDVIERFLENGGGDGFAEELGREGRSSQRILLERASELEGLAAALRDLEGEVRRRILIQEMLMALDRPESEIDLFEVGLLIARLDDPDLDSEHYRGVFSSLVDDARSSLAGRADRDDPRARLEALRDFLFEENGFHGSRTEYYHHANSYLNRVLDDREGIPITLSVIFVEISRRLQIDNVFGAPLPGKFMVGFGDPAADAEEVVYLDVFEGGRILDHRETRREVRSLTGSAPADASFGPASGRDIAVRMLRNLVGIEMNRRQSPERAADYLEMLLAVDPEAAQERFQRALLRIQGEDVSGAKEDIDWLLDRRPPGIDYDRLERFRDSLPEI